jgi:hypothetical protein
MSKAVKKMPSAEEMSKLRKQRLEREELARKTNVSLVSVTNKFGRTRLIQPKQKKEIKYLKFNSKPRTTTHQHMNIEVLLHKNKNPVKGNVVNTNNVNKNVAYIQVVSKIAVDLKKPNTTLNPKSPSFRNNVIEIIKKNNDAKHFANSELFVNSVVKTFQKDKTPQRSSGTNKITMSRSDTTKLKRLFAERRKQMKMKKKPVAKKQKEPLTNILPGELSNSNRSNSESNKNNGGFNINEFENKNSNKSNVNSNNNNSNSNNNKKFQQKLKKDVKKLSEGFKVKRK